MSKCPWRRKPRTADGEHVYDRANGVILSHFGIEEHHQYKHDYTAAPRYQMVTVDPEESEIKDVTWERPLLYAKIRLDDSRVLHVVNLHLKSRIPSNIPGQRVGMGRWKTASGWAEGFFVSSMKRIGQALEVRVLIDRLFDADEEAFVICCGDFNADFDEVPVEAIRGDIENTGNNTLAKRVMVPCERTIPESSRYSLLHRGKGRMIDHLLVSRTLMTYYKNAEIHNEILHDESIAFATDKKYPESDHAPVIADFELPEN